MISHKVQPHHLICLLCSVYIYFIFHVC